MTTAYDFTRRLLFRAVPASLRPLVKAPFYSVRSRLRAAQRRISPPVTASQLTDGLRAGGLRAGDVICVHSSLSAIGDVEGAAPAVIAALQDVVGPEGTILMPAYGSAADVFAAPRPTVDLRTAPSRTGAITETFRRSEGVRRSSHPYASLCAWGRHADDLVSGHHLAPTVCHRDSPLARFHDLRGKLLGIGTTIATQSFFHVVEDTWDEFPLKVYEEPETVSYLDAEGMMIERPLSRAKPHLVSVRIDHPNNPWLRDKMTERLELRGLFQYFPLGKTRAWIIPSVDLFNEGKYLAAHGVTQYSTREDLPPDWPARI
ncbi:MAG: AAC(3) family N-acetyltransferase [Rhodospirillales bacterium]